MHLKHIIDITQESWFIEKPWILLGTGPSLDRFDYDKYKDTHNIAAIYSAVDVCERVDLHLLSDQLAYRELFAPAQNRLQLAKDYDPSKHRYVGTRIVNVPGATPNTVYWVYNCDLKWFNDINLFPEHIVFPCSNTTSFFPMLLSLTNIRELTTCGIDGGTGETSARINQHYRDEAKSVNFDVENAGFYAHCRNHGIRLIKL